jgi:hypothetical protein
MAKPGLSALDIGRAKRQMLCGDCVWRKHMDAAAGMAISRKAFGAVRDTPLWVLVAAASVVLGIGWLRGNQAFLPGALQEWLPLAALVSSVLALCRAADMVLSWLLARRRAGIRRDDRRLTRIYRPLVLLFLTRHVTTSTSNGAPRWRDRVENAWYELSRYRRRVVGLKRATRAPSLISSRPQARKWSMVGTFPLIRFLPLRFSMGTMPTPIS